MRSPIFGPYEVSRSTNASDNQLINLYPEIIETKQGKAVGALYSVPGLTKLATLGAGPIRGLHVLGGKRLFAVSGNGLYQLDQNFNATLIGTVPGSGQVKFIDNGTQIAMFIGNVGFVAPPGYFLTGGTIGSGGVQYAVNDEITLRANDGSQVATAIALVTAVSGGAVTSFTFLQEGSFPVKPTGFTQASTTGSGSGFTITAPTYTAQTGLFPIRMPYTNSDQPISCAYQDGFGVINQPGSNLWFQSNLLDLSSWDPLNFASASGDPDDVLAIAMIHREMWLIKQFETEVWYNAGTVGFTFARLDGVYMQGGIIAIDSLAQSNETLLWLAQTKTGVGIVVQTAGHALRRISTHAIEVQIQKATPVQMMAATAFTYQQQGHEFYVLNVADNTWVYDLTDSEKAGIPLWHQRASFGTVSGIGVGASTSGVGPPAPQPGSGGSGGGGGGGGGSAPFQVDAVVMTQSPVWNMPHVQDGYVGTMSQWIYLDSTNKDLFPDGIPDMFRITTGQGLGSTFIAPGLIPFFSTWAFVHLQDGMFRVQIKHISNATQAFITFYGTDALSQFASLDSDRLVNIQISDPLNPSWSGPGLVGFNFINEFTITVDWDTTGLPTWNNNPLFPNQNRAVFGHVMSVTPTLTTSVFTFSMPHGLDPDSVDSGQVYLSIDFASPFPPAGSGWNGISLASKIKVLSIINDTTITIDLDSRSFTPWTAPLQYGIRMAVLNTIAPEIYHTNFFSDLSTVPQYFYLSRTLTTIPWDTWVNIIISWNMNAAEQSKTLSISFGEKVLPVVYTNDSSPAFTIPYSFDVPISSLVWDVSQFVTVTTATPLGLDIGFKAPIVVENALPIGYNGQFVGTVTGSNTLTYPLASFPGSVTATGDLYFATQGIENGIPVLSPNSYAVLYGTFCYTAEIYLNLTVNLPPTVASNRYLFHDSVTGKAISLGANGQLPTGSAPTAYLSIGPSTNNNFTPPVSLQFVDPAGNGLIQNPGKLGGVTPSRTLVCSFWIDRNLQTYVNTGGVICLGVGSGIGIDCSQNPPVVYVYLNDNGGNTFSFSFPAPVGHGANVRFSVNTDFAVGAKVVHAFVGTEEQTVTVISDDIIDLLITWQDGFSEFDAISSESVGGYIADLWFGPGQLFDITNEFVDMSGNPVPLGANGQLPSGTAPVLYFHCDPGDPATAFYNNRGTGGAFVFESGESSSFILQNATRFSDNLAGNGNMNITLETELTNHGTVLFAPTSPSDQVTSSGQQAIHRALPDNAAFIDAEVTGFNNITVVGDFSNGNLYKLDLDALTDNGQPRKWVRSWRALPQPVESPVSFHKLRVDMETGNAVIDPNTDPQVVLRWSDDGGHTWSNEIFENAGKTGETAHRVQFRRLGATRRNHGLDRIFEISSTDVFPVAIIGADVDVS